MLEVIIPWMLQLAVCPFAGGGYTNNVVSFFSATPNVWFPIVLMAVSVIIGIAALFYMLSPALGRNDMKVWARAKIYDGLVTIVFAIIFVSFSTMLICVNPVTPLNSIGLLPQACNPANAGATPSPSNVADIFGVATCDMYQYNTDLAQFSTSLFWFSLAGGIAPAIPVNLGYGGIGISFTIQLLPIVFVHQYIIPYMQVYYALSIASLLQQYLISSSMLLFSAFIIIGLIARSFGVTKSFGGAMIAFGLGIGVVYPLMVGLTYGFLDSAIAHAAIGGATSGVAVPLDTLGNFLVQSLLNIVNPLNYTNAVFSKIFAPLIMYAGFIGAGLVFIPLLNLVVVDAFIVDFSRSIGERMDLFSILTRIL